MKTTCIILIVFAVIFNNANGQNDTVPVLNVDRPMQAESPYLMQKGFFQIETGARYVDRKDPLKQLQRVRLGTTLLRYGVFSDFELRLSDGYEYVHVQENDNPTDSTESGIGPVSAGFKVLVAKEKGLRPEMSILGTITFRHLGDDAFKPTNSYPLGLLLCSHSITKKLSLNYNIGFSYNGRQMPMAFLFTPFIQVIILRANYGYLLRLMEILIMVMILTILIIQPTILEMEEFVTGSGKIFKLTLLREWHLIKA